MFIFAPVDPLTREELMLDDLRNSVNAAYEEELAEEEKLLEMKSAAESNNTVLVNQIMKEIEQIDYFKNILSKELDRVLNLL